MRLTIHELILARVLKIVKDLSRNLSMEGADANRASSGRRKMSSDRADGARAGGSVSSAEKLSLGRATLEALDLRPMALS